MFLSFFFQVTEIEGRSALLKWGPPIRDQGDDGAKFEPLEHISDANFRYEVLLSDKGKDGKYRSIFVTHSIGMFVCSIYKEHMPIKNRHSLHALIK